MKTILEAVFKTLTGIGVIVLTIWVFTFVAPAVYMFILDTEWVQIILCFILGGAVLGTVGYEIGKFVWEMFGK